MNKIFLLRRALFVFVGLFLSFCLDAQDLLKLDPFYQKTLPNLIGQDFQPRGVYRTPYYAKPSNLHPFSNNPLVSSLWNLCTGSLSQMQTGHYQTMAPNLAVQIDKKETEFGNDYVVELRKDLFWNSLDPKEVGIPNLASCFLKKTKLKALDFKLYLDLIKNLYVELPLAASLRAHYEDLESIEILDDDHFIVHWKGRKNINQAELTGQLKPLPSHVFLYSSDGKPLMEEIDSKTSELLKAKHFISHWAQKTIVSCGPWKLQSCSPNGIELAYNENYPAPFRALFEKMHFVYKASPNTAWQAFKLGELDSFYLTPFQWGDFQRFLHSDLYLKQKEKGGESIEKKEFLTRMYYFVGWNQKKPLFEDQKVRQALTYAIDCNLIIEHFLKGFAQPLSGPFIPGGFAYNETLAPFEVNPKKACELLENAGWHLTQLEGIRQHKETGEPFRFHLIYFLRNELAGSICQYISNSLREVGVDCILEGLDYAPFMQRYQKKDFDALYMAWSLGTPPEDPGQTWGSKEAFKGGSSNIIGYENEEVDALIHQLKVCEDLPSRKLYYHRIHEIIHEEQPYTFLYVPTQIFLHRSSLGNVFIPSERPDLTLNADVQELCPRIFYFREDL